MSRIVTTADAKVLRRIALIVCAVVLAVGASACGGGSGSNTKAPTGASGANTPTTAATTGGAGF